MARILLIETSTALCSAALAVDGKVISSRRSSTDRAHASLTAVFCDEVLRESGLKATDLDAVCISSGPGSYTGLRVGLSTAKGLCFGAGAKLLAVGSLDILAEMGRKDCPKEVKRIVPMIDARRMEVYTATYDLLGNRLDEVQARIIDGESYEGTAAECLFIGDGALKCREVIGAGVFAEANPDAEAMAELAEKEYAAENFRDVAYFEPFYLKDFVVTTSRKKLF